MSENAKRFNTKASVIRPHREFKGGWMACVYLTPWLMRRAHCGAKPDITARL